MGFSMASLGTYFTLATFLFLVAAAILVSFRTRWIQVRALGTMSKMLSGKDVETSDGDGVSPRAALLTALSTALGIGNIVAPVVAVQIGGPPAILGFIMAAIFGSAVMFSEVALAVLMRRRDDKGRIIGGPPPYIEASFGKGVATLYMILGSTMLLTWAAKQSNTMSEILAEHGVPSVVSGVLLASSVVATLFGGIKSVAKVSKRIVPVMVPLYLSITLAVIFHYRANLVTALLRAIGMVKTPEGFRFALSGAAIATAFRWGLSEAVFASQVGIGQAAVPHSHAEGTDPKKQGAIAMAAVFVNAIVCTLSALTVLVLPELPKKLFGVKLLNSVVSNVTGKFGSFVLLVAVVLFAYGTTLGNAYNSVGILRYRVQSGKFLRIFYILVGLSVLLASVTKPILIWKLAQLMTLPVVFINTGAILRHVFRGTLDEFIE